MDDIRMRVLRRAADELEVAKVIGDAQTVAAAQLRFDRLHVRVFRNHPKPVDLRVST
jgi:hypothetical protein